MAIFDIFRKKGEKERYDKKRREKDASKIVSEKPVSTEEQKIESGVSKRKTLKESDIAPVSLVSPHITEKATFLSEKGIYVFKISSNSNKVMVKQAIRELYGVKPTKIRIINSPSKKRFFRGHKGMKSGYKKAMVYLKKGDKIEV